MRVTYQFRLLSFFCVNAPADTNVFRVLPLVFKPLSILLDGWLQLNVFTPGFELRPPGAHNFSGQTG